MGNKTSKIIVSDDNYLIDKYQEKLQQKYKVPLQVIVAHYTPSTFPVTPIINSTTVEICNKSWDIICQRHEEDEFGNKTSGITAFYNEFYSRLDLVDANGAIDTVLSKHSGGTNKIAAKGAILIRIVKYVLAINEDNEETQLKLYMLGKSHCQRQIKPYLYSIFVQTLLQTISSRLGTDASNQVMESWVNLFAFIMKSMLPPAIKNHIVETDLFINTSSIFDAGKIAEEVAEVEEMKYLSRKFKVKVGTSDGGSPSRNTPGSLSIRGNKKSKIGETTGNVVVEDF